MIMITITTTAFKRYGYNDFKKHEYNNLNDFDENI